MKMVEINVYLHGINNGMAVVTARNGDIGKKYLAINKIEFTTHPTSPRQILLRLPEYLAIGEELMAPPSKADDELSYELARILNQPGKTEVGTSTARFETSNGETRRVASEGPGVGGIAKSEVKPLRVNPLMDRALSKLEHELPDDSQGSQG